MLHYAPLYSFTALMLLVDGQVARKKTRTSKCPKTFLWKTFGSTNFFGQGPEEEFLKLLATTQLKIKIVLYTLNEVNIALKHTQKNDYTIQIKFLQNVHTVKVSVTVISQQGNEGYAIFFIF